MDDAAVDLKVVANDTDPDAAHLKTVGRRLGELPRGRHKSPGSATLERPM